MPLGLWSVCVALLVLAICLALYHWSHAANHLAAGQAWWVPFSNLHQDDATRYTSEGERHLRRSWVYRWIALLLGAIVMWGR